MVVGRSVGRAACAALAVVGMVLCGGCGPAGYSGPSGTVSGTVTLAGQPVPQGCAVAFISDAGFAASGIVGADGKYELKIAGEVPTADIPVASYRVCVTPPGDSAEPSEADYDKMMNDAASGGKQAETAPQSAIPAQYQTTTTSKLSYEVTEGANTINIEMQ